MRQALTCIAFAALAAFALAVSAQGVTKDGKRIGTRDEYRVCLETADSVAPRQEELRVRAEKVNSEMKALSEEAPELNAAVRSADNDGVTGSRRTRLERRVKEHDVRLKAAQELQEKLNADVEVFNKYVADYRFNCTGVAFDNDDIAAVKKEREAAGKK